MSDKPLTAAELREALRLLAAELVALPDVDDEQVWRTIGALQALVPDVAGVDGTWSQRWALGKLRERATSRATTEAAPR